MNDVADWPEKFKPLFSDDLSRFLMWGGRAGARSHSTSRRIVQLATQKPLRVACIRWTKASIDDSMRVDIVNGIREMGLEAYWDCNVQTHVRCHNGSVIMFRGLKNQGGLRSLADIDIVWFEEAQYLENPDFEECIDTLDRKEGVKFFVTGNAQFVTDPAYVWSLEQQHRPDAVWLYTTYQDNPFLSAESLQRAKDVKARDQHQYEHDWLGHPLTSSAELTILSENWLESSMKLWHDMGSQRDSFDRNRCFGLDPSDGGDKTVWTGRSGPFLEHMEDATKQRGKVHDALEEIHEWAKQVGPRYLYYDAGAVVGGQVANWYTNRTGVPYRVRGVMFGGPVDGEGVMYNSEKDNKSLFRYKNVQMAWNLRDRAHRSWLLDEGDDRIRMEHCLFIDPEAYSGKHGAPNKNLFMAQMTQPEWKRGEGDRIVMDKAPRDLPSPDCFDSACLAFHMDVENGIRENPR